MMVSDTEITNDTRLSMSEAQCYIEELSNSENDRRLQQLAARYEDAFGHKLDLDSVKAGLLIAADILDCAPWYQ